MQQEIEKRMNKGAISAVQYSPEGFYSRLFLVPKKGGSFRPVIDLSQLNKFITNKHFQMENLTCIKHLLYPLHGQIRPERCLFSGGDSPTITTVPSVYLAGANLSVSMPTVRAKHGTTHFYKTTETRGSIPSHTKHQTSHLPRQHPNHRVISKNPTTTHSPSNGIATEPRFYNQLLEVEAHALPSPRISGICDKHEHNEILPTS